MADNVDPSFLEGLVDLLSGTLNFVSAPVQGAAGALGIVDPSTQETFNMFDVASQASDTTSQGVDKMSASLAALGATQPTEQVPNFFELLFQQTPQNIAAVPSATMDLLSSQTLQTGSPVEPTIAPAPEPVVSAPTQAQVEASQLQDALSQLQAQSGAGTQAFVARGDDTVSGMGTRETGAFDRVAGGQPYKSTSAGQTSRFSVPDASVLKERIQGRAQAQAQEMIQFAQMQKAVNDIELDRATELMVQLSKLGPAQQTQALVELGFTELDDLKKQISAIKERNTLLDKRLKDTLKAQMAKLGLK